MAEAVWNGFLRLSLVAAPVRLTPATTDANVTRLDQLNAGSGNPVAQQFVVTGYVKANGTVQVREAAP